jgi:uncharacterized protein
MLNMNPLRKRIDENMKTAMRAKDGIRLGTIRLLISAIKQREIDERITLDEAQIIAIIEKLIKQRNDSIAQFTVANRDDLVAKETSEIEILKQYLPTPLSTTEIDEIITKTIASVKPTSLKDLGKVIAEVKPLVQGRADMGQISAKIKFLLEKQ